MDMPATRLEVVLPPEYDQKLRQQVMATINEAVKSARQQTYIDSPWLPSKAAWYPVNKIDNLNRDFFVLCHD